MIEATILQFCVIAPPDAHARGSVEAQVFPGTPEGGQVLVTAFQQIPVYLAPMFGQFSVDGTQPHIGAGDGEGAHM
jgi:hypothetical protein